MLLTCSGLVGVSQAVPFPAHDVTVIFCHHVRSSTIAVGPCTMSVMEISVSES